MTQIEKANHHGQGNIDFDKEADEQVSVPLGDDENETKLKKDPS